MTKKGTQNVDIKNKRDCPFGNFLHLYCPLTLLYGRAMKVTLPYKHQCTLYKVELTFFRRTRKNFMVFYQSSFYAYSYSHRVGRVISLSPVVGIGTPPTPHPQASVPPLWLGGRGTLSGERGGGRVPIPTRGHTPWYSIYMYFAPIWFYLTGSPWKKSWILFPFYCFNPPVPGVGRGGRNKGGDACKWFASKVCTLASLCDLQHNG